MTREIDRTFFAARRRALRLALATGTGATLVPALGAFAGCGGGVGEGGTGYASGPITGFGSVIVNDISFDDSAAQVEDGDGGLHLRGDLRLGMTVEIESDAIVDGMARAARVRYDSAVTGPVEQVDADSFVVLGQRVAVDETTVYDASLAAGLGALGVGQVVEVYGFFDSAIARFRATRVERRQGALALYRLRGIVAGLDERVRTLRIGTALFAYADAAAIPSDLSIGSFVRLWVTLALDNFGRWPVQRFGEALRVLREGDSAWVKGHITNLVSPASLRVDGRPVDASAAVVSGGMLALGARVLVIGSVRGGVLVATQVLLVSDQSERDRGFVLRGPIESVAGDRTSLVLRGITIGLTRPALRIVGGSATDLIVGRSIEVRCVVAIGNGARLDALLITLR